MLERIAITTRSLQNVSYTTSSTTVSLEKSLAVSFCSCSAGRCGRRYSGCSTGSCNSSAGYHSTEMALAQEKFHG